MPTLELNIDWSVFDQVQREMVEKAIQLGHYEQLAALLYEVTPEQATEIEKIQRQYRPREFKFDSKVQQDFEIFAQEHFNDLTPEMVNEWQIKMEDEKTEKLRAMNGGIIEDSKIAVLDGGNQLTATVSNDLHGVKGLGVTSITRLNAANIYGVDELRKLSQEKRQEILGPLVASKIKSLI